MALGDAVEVLVAEDDVGGTRVGPAALEPPGPQRPLRRPAIGDGGRPG